MQAFIEIRKNGKIVESRKSKSFLIAFVGLIARQWCQDTDLLNDTGGNAHTLGSTDHRLECESPGGMGFTHSDLYYPNYQLESDRVGIVVGSGTGAVAPSDYALGTQIRSGDTTSKLFYHGTGLHSFSVNVGAGTAQFEIEAIFQNKSGGSIDVKEVGLYTNGLVGYQVYPNRFGYCILRDNITTVTLSNGEFLQVVYTISIAA